MKSAFWTVLVFVAAVALALVLREHAGNVIIVAQPWRIEVSLTLFVLLLIASFIALYVLLRLLAWLGSSPDRVRSWRWRRGQKREQDLLEAGWIHILEGRYPDAERDLSKLVGRTRSTGRKVLASLALARASHHLGEYNRRDEALKLATGAAEDPRMREAAATVAAELYLDQNRAQDALELLQPLQDASSRYLHTTRLLLRAHRQLHNYDRVYELTRLLARRGAIDEIEARQLIETSTAARLAAGGPDGFKSIWNDLRSDERVLPDIALTAANIQATQGRHDEAGKILETALNAHMEPRLLSAYAQCPPEFVPKRLSKAEDWLKRHPDDPALLATLGTLCLTGELWGPGERYLRRSMELRSDIRIHALLGNLYDKLGRQSDAMKHWRLASGVAGALPALHIHRPLPAADTRSDPTLVEASDLSEQAPPAETVAPVAASAADFIDDVSSATLEEEREVPAAKEATAKRAETSEELDQYFDTAPIPGVDLSETSDQPRRH